MLLMITVVIISIVSSGCEKNGKIKIINQTAHALYAEVLDNNYVLSDSSTKTIDVTTGRKDPFTGDVGKWVRVTLKGETYQIWDGFLDRYVDSTYVWVSAGKTVSIYTRPNRASVKVKNQSGKHIKRIIIRKNTNLTTIRDTYNVDLPNGNEWHQPIQYSDSDNVFYVTVQVDFDDDSSKLYGDPQSIYGLDKQFLIEVLPPFKK